MRVRGSLASLVGAACWGWEGRDGAFEHVRTSWVTRLWVPSGWGGTWRVAPVRLAARTEGRSRAGQAVEGASRRWYGCGQGCPIQCRLLGDGASEVVNIYGGSDGTVSRLSGFRWPRDKSLSRRLGIQ